MIAGILLAAGAARRFGANKLLVPLPDGTPMALAAALALKAAVPHSAAVIRRGEHELASLLGEAGLLVVPCARAEEGLSASLRCGIEATAEADGWLVALADMPFVKVETIARLAAALAEPRPAAIVAPLYRGQRGHPVGFARRYRAELAALDGDEGARVLLERHRERLHLVEVDDPGVVLDIDRRAELDALMLS
jgi:molybdenum cofactor cytidylyltransferase